MSDYREAKGPPPGGFLKTYDGVSEEHKWSLILDWFKYSPLAFFKELRENRPIMETPEGFLAARFDDIVEILDQPRLFTVKLYKPKMFSYLMTEDDTPLHNTEKAIMESYLRAEDMPGVRALIADRAAKILDEALGNIDLAYDYARMVPVLMVREYFGLDGVDSRKLILWSYWNQYNTFHNQPFHRLPNATEIHDTMMKNNKKLSLYVGTLVARKLLKLKLGSRMDDVASRVLSAKYPRDANFSLARQAINIGGLLIGAVETTSQAVIQAIEMLIARRREKLPEAQELARSGDTEKFDRMVWEALRFNATFKYMFRTAAEDAVIARGTERETRVPAGATVFPLIQSGMFDSEKFPDPDSFNPDRPYGAGFHLGYGSHICMGRMVGMEMIPEMVRQVILRTDIQENAPVNYRGGALPEEYKVSWVID